MGDSESRLFDEFKTKFGTLGIVGCNETKYNENSQKIDSILKHVCCLLMSIFI